MPEDFIPIAETRLNSTLSALSNNIQATERLYLHERFAHPCIELELF